MRKRSVTTKFVSIAAEQNVPQNNEPITLQEQNPTNNAPNSLASQLHLAETQALSPLVERALKRTSLPYDSFVRLITQGAFKGVTAWTSLDLDRLLMAAERYGLDPLRREIFMMQPYSDPTAALLLVIGVDGWMRLINAHEQFEGIEFAEATELEHGVPSWIECTIYRRDRRVPLKLREYYCEARGEHILWVTHPRRMLRHKSLVQCARLAFGLTGLYDAEEAHRARQHKAEDGRFLGADKLAQKLSTQTQVNPATTQAS